MSPRRSVHRVLWFRACRFYTGHRMRTAIIHTATVTASRTTLITTIADQGIVTEDLLDSTTRVVSKQSKTRRSRSECFGFSFYSRLRFSQDSPGREAAGVLIT